MREFDFEVFLSFGAAVMPFIERRAGFNFDPADPADVAFMDRIAEEDDALLRAQAYPASNMIARLRHRGSAGAAVFEPVTPQRHVALTQDQMRRAS